MSGELVIAEIISDVSLWGIGRDLGEPVLHDDGSKPGMVDILFSDTDPPVVMEVTAIVDDHFLQTADAAQKTVERRLTQEADDSGHALDWTFHVAAGASLKSLEGVMRAIVRGGQAPTGRDIAPGLNKVDAEPSATPQVTVATWNTSGTGGLRGFGPELVQAIEANRVKLGNAGAYERHLAVDIDGMRLSDPGESPCPQLPPEIDYLWVTRRAYSLRRGSPVVWVSDGIQPWRANGTPDEAM